MSQMAENNIGSLVVLKPGDEHLAGIITERGNFIYLFFYVFIYASKLSEVILGH